MAHIQIHSQHGQIMKEYIIVTVFLSILVWYAIVGGGGWTDTTLTEGTGTYYDEYHDTAGLEAPGLVQAINNSQDRFAGEIYKP